MGNIKYKRMRLDQLPEELPIGIFKVKINTKTFKTLHLTNLKIKDFSHLILNNYEIIEIYETK